MKANKNLFVSARVDKETKDWMNDHPLSATQLINYGLYLIRTMEKNLKDARTHITTITIQPKDQDNLPF